MPLPCLEPSLGSPLSLESKPNLWHRKPFQVGLSTWSSSCTGCRIVMQTLRSTARAPWGMDALVHTPVPELIAHSSAHTLCLVGCWVCWSNWHKMMMNGWCFLFSLLVMFAHLLLEYPSFFFLTGLHVFATSIRYHKNLLLDLSRLYPGCPSLKRNPQLWCHYIDTIFAWLCFVSFNDHALRLFYYILCEISHHLL